MAPDPFRVQETRSKRFRLTRGKHRWVEGNFVSPDISDEHAVMYAQTDGYIGTVLQPRQFFSLAIGMGLMVAVLLGRASFLQLWRGTSYRQDSDNNRLRTEPIRADRGLIYDRFMTPLVRNVPNYRVTIRPRALPSDLQKRTALLTDLYTHTLSSYVGKPIDQFLHDMEAARASRTLADQDLVVAEFLKQDDAVQLQIQAQEVPALQVEMIAKREYLNDGPSIGSRTDTIVYPPVKSLSHLLGYMTRLQPGEYEQRVSQGYVFNDSVGRTGLEAEYEPLLRGTFGQQEIEVDAQGRFKQTLSEQQPHDGDSIQISLDLEMQRQAEAILSHYMQLGNKQAGSFTVLNPNTGEVLAMVSLPTYDDNLFSRGIDQTTYSGLINDPNHPLINRAVSGQYPSGSIFKPIVAAAALQEGIITPQTTFLSVGGIQINQWFFPDWKVGGHGVTNLYKGMAESVNTFFYIVGGGYDQFQGLGVQRISDYARKFGIASPLGIDLPAEASGFLPSKEWKETAKQEPWYIGDTYHLAIGQGDLLVTPLQMASEMATFANGGTVYKPHLVTAIVDKDLHVQQQIQPTVLNTNFIDPAYIKDVQTALRDVVTIGSGVRLNSLPIPVSGKTGTAQWNTKKDPHAWFVGYAPSDHPTIAFAIMVEEGTEGSAITVSIAHDFLNWWYNHRYSVDN